MRGAAREVSAALRMSAGIGAEGDAVLVDIGVAAEIRAVVEVGCCENLAAIVAALVVPGQRSAQAMVHADVEIHHHEHRRLQAVGEVEGVRAELERFRRVFRQQQHMLGVCWVRVGMPVEGPARWTLNSTAGISAK